MNGVEGLMTAVVHTAGTTDVVGPIRDHLREHQVHSVPILDPQGRLAEIVTSSDRVDMVRPDGRANRDESLFRDGLPAPALWLTPRGPGSTGGSTIWW